MFLTLCKTSIIILYSSLNEVPNVLKNWANYSLRLKEVIPKLKTERMKNYDPY